MPVHHIIIREYRDHELFVEALTPDAAVDIALARVRHNAGAGMKIDVLRGPEPPRRRRSDPKESAQP